MTSAWGGGGTVNVNASGTILPEVFIATNGQKEFVLTKFTYTVGSNSIYVFINGQLQVLTTDYTETSSTKITLVDACVGGERITCLGFPLANIIQPSGTFAQQTSPSGSLIMPAGTTAQRDAAPNAGYARWNITLGRLEVYTGSTWTGAGTGAVLPVLRRDGTTITNVSVV